MEKVSEITSNRAKRKEAGITKAMSLSTVYQVTDRKFREMMPLALPRGWESLTESYGPIHQGFVKLKLSTANLVIGFNMRVLVACRVEEGVLLMEFIIQTEHRWATTDEMMEVRRVFVNEHTRATVLLPAVEDKPPTLRQIQMICALNDTDSPILPASDSGIIITG